MQPFSRTSRIYGVGYAMVVQKVDIVIHRVVIFSKVSKIFIYWEFSILMSVYPSFLCCPPFVQLAPLDLIFQNFSGNDIFYRLSLHRHALKRRSKTTHNYLLQFYCSNTVYSWKINRTQYKFPSKTQTASI